MDINTQEDQIVGRWKNAERLASPESSPVVFSAVMVCQVLGDVASQLGRIADILTVRLK